MSTYNLLEHFEDLDDVKKLKEHDSNPEAYFNKNVFKDKKLNKLWMKAEMAGFNSMFYVLHPLKNDRTYVTELRTNFISIYS